MPPRKAVGRIDLAKYRAYVHEREGTAHTATQPSELVTRAKIRLIEDQLKEARVGRYTIRCDESKANKGGGTAPSPLQYFIAAIGF